MKNTSLFDSFQLGKITLSSRIVMAPMTRSRAHQNKTPSELAMTYYQQRSSAGLIITEGTSTSLNGDGYARVPGIYNETQIAAWKKITDAVHQNNGKIFLQLMHTGRIGHPDNKNIDAEIIAPSAIKANGKIFTDNLGQQEFIVPRALQTHEILTVIDEYHQATRNAFSAGFDGVELHAASGYLPEQFLSSNTNHRNDQYGGSIQNRQRFILELLETMIAVNGPDKIGIRIWPGSHFNDIHHENPLETFTHLLKALNAFDLAYVHSIRSPEHHIDSFQLVRKYFNGTSIINGGFDFNSAQNALNDGQGDLISFGNLFISNPDLVERFKNNLPLNIADPTTFYTPGANGYVDYPSL